MIRYYYDLTDGFIFFETNYKSDRTLEQDLEVFKPLQERVEGTYSYIDKEYSEIQTDLENCAGISVDLNTRDLVFSYNDNENGEPVYQAPLSEQIKTLKEQLQTTQDAVDFLIINGGM